MMEHVLTLLCKESPDPYEPRHQIEAGGDLRNSIWRSFSSLSRILSSMDADSASVRSVLHYIPAGKSDHPNTRLRFYMTAHSKQQEAAASLRMLAPKYLQNASYVVAEVSDMPVAWDGVRSLCNITRRVDLLKPLVPLDENDQLPENYMCIKHFKPNPHNDFLLLDKALDESDEQVIIVVGVKPVSIESEVRAHGRLLTSLEAANSTWEWDGGDAYIPDDLPDFQKGMPDRPAVPLKPLRRRDPLASHVLRSQQQLHEGFSEPHLAFSIIVGAETRPTADHIASVVAESCFEEGSYCLKAIAEDSSEQSVLLESLRSGEVPLISTDNSLAENTDAYQYSSLMRLASVATAKELEGCFRWPVAGCASPLCFRKDTDPPVEDSEDLLSLGHDAERESFRDKSKHSLGIPNSYLLRHMSVFGVPGSGKTNTLFNILKQLHTAGIPLLALDMGNPQFRYIKKLRNHPNKIIRRFAKSLRIYDPASKKLSHFRYNPLEIEPGVQIDEHIEMVLFCFAAAFSVPGPLIGILREALYRLYDKFPNPEHPPLLTELLALVEEVLEEKQYAPEIHSTLRAAIDVRLGELTQGAIGRVFGCRHSVPSTQTLMSSSSVLETGRLGSCASKVLTLFQLYRIYNYAIANHHEHKGLWFSWIVDEAHNVVGTNTDAKPSESLADPAAFTAGFVCKMLCEMRSMGVAGIIADQHPEKVALDVIRTTATKIVFRVVNRSDRELIGGAMNLSELRVEDLANLPTGEAFFYREGYRAPRRIVTPNLYALWGLPSSLSDDDLAKIVREEPWYEGEALERSCQELGNLCIALAVLDDSIGAIAKRYANVYAALCEAIARRQEVLAYQKQAVVEAREMRRELQVLYNVFVRGPYRNVRDNSYPKDAQPFRIQLEKRFTEIIKPDIESCLAQMDQFIEKYSINQQERQKHENGNRNKE